MKFLLLCSLILVGCGKTVNFKHKPPVSPPTTPNPPSSIISYTLANHSDTPSLWTSPVRILESQIFGSQPVIASFTAPFMTGDNVYVYLNGNPICRYIFYSGVLNKEECVEKIEVVSGDILQVYGVANYYGITLKFSILTPP